MSDDAPIVSVKISKRIQIWGGRQIVAVKIQRIYLRPHVLIIILVKSTCFLQFLVNLSFFATTIVQISTRVYGIRSLRGVTYQ